MADAKITELNENTAPAPDDVLAIVDVDADETKKIEVQDLIKITNAQTLARTLGS